MRLRAIITSRMASGDFVKFLGILTHFGMTMYRAKPWELTQQLSQETGVEVRAASDGTTFEL